MEFQSRKRLYIRRTTMDDFRIRFTHPVAPLLPLCRGKERFVGGDAKGGQGKILGCASAEGGRRVLDNREELELILHIVSHYRSPSIDSNEAHQLSRSKLNGAN